MSNRPVIVVGTGRCGSTLLSQMVRQHPDLLSVSEVFSFTTDLGTRIERAFPVGALSGAEFWNVLSSPQPRQSLLLTHGLQMPEVIYPWERGRFEPGGLPPIMQGMVPHLDGLDPDVLFDELAAEVCRWDAAPVDVHYRRFFSDLAARFGKRQWVERSGGSLRVVERLVEAFPEAAVVHIVRDGRDTALSMSQHIGFRMAILCGFQIEQLGVDPFESSERTDEADLSDELADTLPENFTAEAFERFDLPPSLCGHYWAGEIVSGLTALEKVPPESLLTLRYEDLVCAPVDTVARLGSFIGAEVRSDWLAESAALVRNERPRWPKLGISQQEELARACQPGFDALREVGLRWSNHP